MLTLPWTAPVLKRFIVFEGLDGAGTTTQARRLANYLTDRGEVSTFTCEPTDMPIGVTIREILHSEESITSWSLALLFAADRHEHIEHPHTGVRAMVESGETVVCDRYLFSSLAYQGAFADFSAVESLNNAFPLPEHLIFIDTPRDEAQRRMGNRTKLDRLESDTVQTRVERMYREIVDDFESSSSVTVHRIDGSAGVDEIFDQIIAAVGR